MAHLTPTERTIIETLERIGGGVTLPELAYQLKHPDAAQLHATLDSLIRRREVYPWAYTTPSAGGVLLRLSQAGTGARDPRLVIPPRMEGPGIATTMEATS